MKEGKIVIFCAPSGSGKSTIVQHLLKIYPTLAFSISATSRAPRGAEQNGREYYFITADEFRAKIEADELVEWQEVYAGSYYGTLKSEVERLWADGKVVVFDIDVYGGINLKNMFGDRALGVFIQAPSIEELRRRLVGRATDSSEAIERRIAKAAEEMAQAGKFDVVLVNDDLEKAYREAEGLIEEFLAK